MNKVRFLNTELNSYISTLERDSQIMSSGGGLPSKHRDSAILVSYLKITRGDGITLVFPFLPVGMNVHFLG